MGNIIPIPHGMFDGMQGQNYEIDGAISFALEAVGEADYDYWFVAGLTGDSFNPVSYTHLDVYKRQAPACADS